jgi:hypothetical protein
VDDEDEVEVKVEQGAGGSGDDEGEIEEIERKNEFGNDDDEEVTNPRGEWREKIDVVNEGDM